MASKLNHLHWFDFKHSGTVLFCLNHSHFCYYPTFPEWLKVKADQICFWSAFVGLRSGVSGGFYSFWAIYLEVKLFFAIFANGKCVTMMK